MNTNEAAVEFIEPRNELILKTGTGGLPESTLNAIQQKIDGLTLNIEPFLQEKLQSLKSLIQQDNFMSSAKSDIIHDFLTDVIAFNVHVKMTTKHGLTTISTSLLRFSERLDHINIDSHHVIKAHVNAMDVIMRKNISDDHKDIINAFIKELDDACDRYHKKYMGSSSH